MKTIIKRVIRAVISKALGIYNVVSAEDFQKTAGLSLPLSTNIDGRPLIDIRNGGKVKVGEGVTLNSSNHGYHLNMYGPVKLFADRSGARIEIGDNTRIHGSCLHAYTHISIGKRCLIAANCNIIDGSGHDASLDDVENRIHTVGIALPITIEDDVWIGANSLILPGVTIGKGSVIGAGSVVSKDIPAYCVAAGVPAKVIKQRQPQS